MKMKNLWLILGAIALCGCASNKKAELKPIYERPWVGGHFQSVPTPASARTNSNAFGKTAPLITDLHEKTPLRAAGLQEGDLILAINGARASHPEDIYSLVERSGTDAATFTVYRDGDFIEKTVVPGNERYQKTRYVMFGIGLSSRLEFDLVPDPDFSLVALGYERRRDRLDLHDNVSKHLQEVSAIENKAHEQHDSGYHSEEGWKFWLGPFSFAEQLTILSQDGREL